MKIILRKKDGSSIWLVNTNKLVKFYEGMDGLKTGYTSSAGYCLTATAFKNNLRFISVVMGEESIENRTEDTLKLLNFAFNTVKKEVILSSSKPVDILKLKLSNKDKVKVYLKNDIARLTDINSDKLKYKYNVTYNKEKIKYPLKNGDKVGRIKVIESDGNIIYEDIIVKENIRKIKFSKLFRKNIKMIVSGNM